MVRWHGQVRYDLATSGIAPVSASELGAISLDMSVSRERFIQEIANHYGIPEQEVTPCLGTSGALFTAYACVLDAGQRALIETPGYEPLSRIAEALGRGVDYFERRVEHAFQIEIEPVIDALKPDTRLVVITNPHNPSGALTPQSRIAELALELEARGVFLLVDEVYLDAEQPGVTVRQLAPRVLTCSSATKCWGVPWARAGWLLAPAEISALTGRVERCTLGQAPPSAWAIGVRVFEEKHALRARAAALQSGKRALIDAFVARQHTRLTWCAPSEHSAFGWLRDIRGRDLRPLLERGMLAHGVFAVPGEFFGDKTALRVGWTSDIAALGAGLPLLEQVLA